MEIEELKKKKEAQINGLFFLMIEIAVIFAVPGVIAVLLGKYLDGDMVGKYTISLLAVAFVISWVLVIILYRRKTKALEATEALVKQAKQAQK